MVPQPEFSRLKEIKEWLLEYMGGISRVGAPTPLENYVEAGVVDSYGIIVLVETVERHYDIRFDSREFQDRRFQTVSGLAEIIDGKLRLRH